jgi:hypothetical protein
MRHIIYCLIFFITISLQSQELDPDLVMIQKKMEQVQSYDAHVTFNVDISFINMPTKKAVVQYEKGKKISFKSDDFVLIPKKGLDFSMEQLFSEPFFTVDRGDEELNGRTYKVVNVIPTSNKSDFSIAKLYLDRTYKRIQAFEISTKREGVYMVAFDFLKETHLLPDKVTVQFEVEKVSLPFNFMGKDTDIDRKEMKENGPKKGAIYLTIDYKNLVITGN